MAVVTSIPPSDEHRDLGSGTYSDIPRSRLGTHSGQILADALRGTERDSPAEKALIVALDIIAREHSAAAPPTDGGGPSQRFFVRLAALMIAALSFVQPSVSAVAERYVSPSTAIASKLDDMLVQSAKLAEDNRALHAQLAEEYRALYVSVVSAVRWIVEAEIARRADSPMPRIPPAVNLMLAQDELDRTTGL